MLRGRMGELVHPDNPGFTNGDWEKSGMGESTSSGICRLRLTKTSIVSV
ncbi:MAG TPA: hypothetical protein VMW76_01950 [Bacteroidales bacterium]|nr:hypothetical protein [Bacteroidales bacterium]